jgi:hypothetical protein
MYFEKTRLDRISRSDITAQSNAGRFEPGGLSTQTGLT